jgi:hypothetical protein
MAEHFTALPGSPHDISAAVGGSEICDRCRRRKRAVWLSIDLDKVRAHGAVSDKSSSAR